jgi:hypothetical protein
MRMSRFAGRATERASRIALLVAAGVWAAARPVSSGDLWIGLGCGRYILSHGVTRDDPFAFTSLPGGWIDQNWLSHVLLTGIYSIAGLGGLAIWRGIVSIAIVWLAADTAVALGAAPLLASAAAVALGIVGHAFFDMRPNLHTLLLTAILMRVLVGVERRRLRDLWPVLLIAVLWSNLHGGFLFGVIAAAAAAAAVAVERIVRRGRITAWPGIAALAPATILAALASPYGLTNLTHPWEISVGPDAQFWRTVAEWRSSLAPDALTDPGVRSFWILVAFGILVGLVSILLWRKRPTPGADPARGGSLPAALAPGGAIALSALLLALESRRFVPLFAVVFLPWVAALATRSYRGARVRVPSIVWPAAAAAALIATASAIAPRFFLANALWPGSFTWPERLMRTDEEPLDAIRYLIGTGASGRLFTHWTWGGRLLFADPMENGSARYRIYIDGRAQAAYPASVSRDYARVESAAARDAAGAVAGFLDAYDVDLCVCDRRRHADFALIMTQLPGWVSMYGDDKAIVAVRSDMVPSLRDGPFPDEAVARASEALRLRTSAGGRLDPATAQKAFYSAIASVRIRPTAIGIAEMILIARMVETGAAGPMRAEAEHLCDSVLAPPVPSRGPLWDALVLRANAAQYRAGLARADHDLPTARQRQAEASSLVERANRIIAPYLR